MRALLVAPANPPDFWSFPETSKVQQAQTLLPPLGLLTLAGLLPPEYEVRFKDLNTGPLSPEDWSWAQVLMISGMHAHYGGMRELIAQAKQRSLPVVAGGPGPSGLPEVYLEAGADVVFAGEAEAGLEEMLAALAAGESGRLIRAEPGPDLAVSPVPRYDLINFKDYWCMPVQTTRGCPHDCEFCDIISLYGRRVRHKSPAQVLAELQTLHDLGWWGDVFFCDDNFIGHRGHVRSLLGELDRWSIDHGKPFHFITQASLDLGAEPELMDLMTRAMVDWVFVGVESPDEQVLATAGKKQNLRHSPVEMIDNMKKDGITVVASIMVGCDGEAPGVDRRVMDLINRTSVPMVMVNEAAAVPGTKLWHRLEREGRLQPDKEAFERYGFPAAMVPQRDPRQIQAEFSALWDELYDPANYLQRCFDYHLAMRPTRAAQARAQGLEPEPEDRSGTKPQRQKTGDLRKFFWIMRRHGLLVRPSRMARFWRQLLAMKRRNPSRVVRYMSQLGLGTDLIEMRKRMNAQPK